MLNFLFCLSFCLNWTLQPLEYVAIERTVVLSTYPIPNITSRGLL